MRQAARIADFDYFGNIGLTLPIERIARRLSHIPRHAGDTLYHLSVAQHSCVVSDIVRRWGNNKTRQLQGLLHDGHESVMGDIPTPFHEWLTAITPGGYDTLNRAKFLLDKRLLPPLGVAFPFPEEDYAIVKAADRVALVLEARSSFFDPTPFYAYNHPLADLYDQLLDKYGEAGIESITLERMSPEQARESFLLRYVELTG